MRASDGAGRGYEEFPVVIVGGGPVGLTASILLSQAGIRSLLVERHPGTAIHTKARAINGRTRWRSSINAASRTPSAPLAWRRNRPA